MVETDSNFGISLPARSLIVIGLQAGSVFGFANAAGQDNAIRKREASLIAWSFIKRSSLEKRVADSSETNSNGLTPLVLTINASRLVDTEDPTAFGAGPPFCFASNKTPYTEFPDVLEILNHAHAILGSIPLIQGVKPVARKAVTTEAVVDFILPYLLTSLYGTCNTGFWLDAIITSATGAGFLISDIRATEATIHSTGGNQFFSHDAFLRISDDSIRNAIE